jgi:hypothetical protein
MNKNNGSCLLLLTLISSVILIFAINSWQTILLNSDLVLKKYNYEFNFRILEGLHNFAIFQCISNPHNLSKKNSNNGTIISIVLYKGPWPAESDLESIRITNLTLYDSIIKLTINEEFSIINSQLVNPKTGESYFMESKIKKIVIPGGNNESITRFRLYDWKF